MNTLGLNFQTLCQLFWSFCQLKCLPKANYVVYGLPDLIDGVRPIGEDIHQIAILFDSIGEGPGKMEEGPMWLDPPACSDLIVLQHEEVLQFAKAALNTPSHSIQIEDQLRGKPRVVADQNVYFAWILSTIGTEKDNDFQGYLAVFDLALQGIGFNVSDLSIRTMNSYWLYFMPVMLFDEGNELVLPHEAVLPTDRMINPDVPIGLDLSDDGEALRVQRLDKPGRMGIPGIKNHNGKPDLLGYGVVDELLGQLYFAFELRQSFFIEFFLLLIESEINKKVLGLRGKGRGDENVADRFVSQCATVLVSGAFRFLGEYLGTGGIIDDQDAIRRRSRSALFLYKSDSFTIELLVIPFGFREEVLEALVLTGGGFGHDLHIGALHVLKQKTDVKAEVEELARREVARKPRKKLFDETQVGIEDMHDLCCCHGSDGFTQLPTVQRTRVFFYGIICRIALNSHKLIRTRLMAGSFF